MTSTSSIQINAAIIKMYYITLNGAQYAGIQNLWRVLGRWRVQAAQSPVVWRRVPGSAGWVGGAGSMCSGGARLAL